MALNRLHFNTKLVIRFVINVELSLTLSMIINIFMLLSIFMELNWLEIKKIVKHSFWSHFVGHTGRQTAWSYTQLYSTLYRTIQHNYTGLRLILPVKGTNHLLCIQVRSFLHENVD